MQHCTYYKPLHTKPCSIKDFGALKICLQTASNALLGTSALPIDMIPITGAAIIIRYGDELSTRVTLLNRTMLFIKIDNIVINTNYIAAVKLESETCSGEKCVSILLATPKFPLLELEASNQNPYHYEWLEFTGKQAQVLQIYFSSFNNVIDLLP